MLEFKSGNIFDSGCEALVNAVNCEGIMGAGLALQFKRLYPDMYVDYQNYCWDKTLKPGIMHVYKVHDSNCKYIINFPTKNNWKNPSKKEYIADGLLDLINAINNYKIKSIAIPALGCGLGGLSWDFVKEMIIRYLLDIDCHVVVYEPK